MEIYKVDNSVVLPGDFRFDPTDLIYAGKITKMDGTADQITPGGRVFTYSKVADDSAPVSGKVREASQYVKYVYTQVKGGVQITYVAVFGQPIRPAVTDTASAQSERHTTPRITRASIRLPWSVQTARLMSWSRRVTTQSVA